MAIPTPLTTTYTPPAACFTDLYTIPDQAAWLGPGTQCIPSGPNPTLSTYFSPGLFCPSGYTVACSTEVSLGSVTQTQATCCPHIENINGVVGAPFSCQVETSKPWYNTFGCTMQYGSMVDNGPFTLTVIDGDSTSTTSFQAKSTYGLNAYSVQLAWQASDLVTTTTPVAESGSSSVSGISGPGVVTVIAASSSSAIQAKQELGQSGLSMTTKIAIGVVMPVAVLLALAIGGLVLTKRRKRRELHSSHIHQQSEAGLSGLGGNHDKPQDSGGPGGLYEVEGIAKYPQVHEMSCDHSMRLFTHELDANRYR